MDRIKWIDAVMCFKLQGVVNAVKSDWAPVVSSVPQGPVLVPCCTPMTPLEIGFEISTSQM